MPEEIVFDESEVEPIVASPPPYDQVIVFGEDEVEIVEAGPPGYDRVTANRSETEPLQVEDEPAYEIVFDEVESEPFVAPRPYEAVFDEPEAESALAAPPIRDDSRADQDQTGRPYGGVLAPPARSGPSAPGRRIDFDPALIRGTRPRTGPMPVQRTTGLTEPHRRLLGKRVIGADPIERWGVREAGRAWTERRLSRSGTSTFLADYKDRWVRAHRDVITTAARRYDIPAWVLGSVAWTEVGGDPEAQDEIAVLGLRPEKVSFGPVQMELRRAAEELGYDPLRMSAIQRRVVIWSLLDPQQNLFLVASHLDRLRDLDVPARPASELTDEDIRVLGARYNRGPEPTREQILTTGKKTEYGDAVLAKRNRIERLLQDAGR